MTIGDSVSTIGEAAFCDCASLTSVTIPQSVTTIGGGAFCRCNSIQNVYYSGTQTDWDRIKIGKENDCLTGANITFNSNHP
jgi:hypothetical protein